MTWTVPLGYTGEIPGSMAFRRGRRCHDIPSARF
jgi:hypothetical protein